MPARVLITGAQGFVGRYTAAHWLESDPSASIIGIGRSGQLFRSFTHRIEWNGARLRAPLPEELRLALATERYRYIRVDLRDRPNLVDLLKEVRPSVVLHLAGALRDEPTKRLFALNVLATESLFEAIVEAAIEPPTLVLGSTGSLYGKVPAGRIPIREEEPPAPFDSYSVSKEAAERLAGILAARHGIPTMYARIFNVVGPGQDERHLCGWLARQMVAVRCGLQSDLVVGPLDTTRDFIDVRDVARALRALALAGSPGAVYNVGSGVESPTRGVFDALRELAGLDGHIPVTAGPARPADCQRLVADVGRLHAVGYVPAFNLRQSLADVLQYYTTTVAGRVQRKGSPAAGAPPR